MKLKFALTAVAAFSVVIAWLLVVDWSWFIDECPDCVYHQDVLQYRLAGCVVREVIRPDVNLLQKFAADIGRECRHPLMKRWHKHRYWGLWYCACPCINGMTSLSGDTSWYDQNVSLKVQAFARTNPSFPDEFSRRVLQNHEFSFVGEALKRADIGPGIREEGEETPNKPNISGKSD